MPITSIEYTYQSVEFINVVESVLNDYCIFLEMIKYAEGSTPKRKNKISLNYNRTHMIDTNLNNYF